MPDLELNSTAYLEELAIARDVAYLTFIRQAHAYGVTIRIVDADLAVLDHISKNLPRKFLEVYSNWPEAGDSGVLLRPAIPDTALDEDTCVILDCEGAGGSLGRLAEIVFKQGTSCTVIHLTLNDRVYSPDTELGTLWCTAVETLTFGDVLAYIFPK